MKFKGNLSLEWYQKHKSITLSPLTDSSCPPMLNWVNKDGALFYEIDASQARGLRPVWTSASDYRVREARPLEFVRRFEFAGNFMAPECKTIATPKAPGLPIDENIIIRGDNLLALNTLVAHMEGREETDKVKCIYIDPPYNTGSAFQHYDDNLEHSIWLTMMRDRLVLLRRLLREDGAIFVQCDDKNHAYLKIMLDEIFGPQNFIIDVIWRKKSGGGQNTQKIIREHEYIICFQKNNWDIIEETCEHSELEFKKIINGKKAKLVKLEKWGSSSYKEDRPSLYYSIKDPNGLDFYPKAPDGRDGRWRKKPESLDKAHIFWDNHNGNYVPYEVIYYEEYKDKEKIIKQRSILLDKGNTTEAAKEILALFGKQLFDTPKPEALIEYLLSISTKPKDKEYLGDLVFDAFGGSGTTFAVAHKMGRRYIGIEVGEHADTLILPRLQKVIAGQDKCGISPKIGWQGGGGFSYYHLGESVLMQNTAGDWALNRSLPAEDLQRAILRTFDAPLQKSQGGWAYGHNGAEGYLVCLEDADGNLTAEEIASAMAQLCPTDKPYLLTGLCLSASDSELDKLLKGCYPLPYALMPQGGEE